MIAAPVAREGRGEGTTSSPLMTHWVVHKRDQFYQEPQEVLTNHSGFSVDALPILFGRSSQVGINHPHPLSYPWENQSYWLESKQDGWEPQQPYWTLGWTSYNKGGKAMRQRRLGL